MATLTGIPIGSLFSSYDVADTLTADPTPSSIKLDLDSVGAVGAANFNPVENGTLQWLNDSGYWTPVTSSTSIKVGLDGENDLRFIPTAEASRLGSNVALKLAEVAVDPRGATSPTISLTLNDGAAFSYASGQAIGINRVNLDIGADLAVQVPVTGALGVASSGVSDNAVALADGTSFGGVLGNPSVHGDPSTDITFKSGADLSVLADVKTKITADASSSADSATDYADADAHTRVGIKLPPDAAGYVSPQQGGFGVLNMDMVAGGDATVRGTTDIGAQTTTDSTSGRARSTTDVGQVVGVGDTAIEAAADLSLTGIAGANLRTDAQSAMGSAESFTSLQSLRGVFSDATDPTGTSTGALLNNPGLTEDSPYQAGADLSIATGVNLVAHTSASVVGDGLGDAFESQDQYQKGDSATAIAELGNAFGLASNAKGGLLMEADGRIDLDITSKAAILTEADAISGHATAISEILSNNGAINAVLEAGDSGSIRASSTTLFETTANTIVGDSLANGTALDTVAIGASMFDFTGLGGIVEANALTNGRVKAVSTKGEASASINSSTGGIQASTSNDASWLDNPFDNQPTGPGSFKATMDGAERIAAITTNQGFALAAAVAGDGAHNGVTATAIQSALGVDGYTFSTSESMHLSSDTHLDSTAHAVFGTTSV
jgi:hypothetical protein